MRTQITAYLNPKTKLWLRKYAADCRLGESEVVRLLVQREERIGWLKWAQSAPDPAQGPAPPLLAAEDVVSETSPKKGAGRRPRGATGSEE